MGKNRLCCSKRELSLLVKKGEGRARIAPRKRGDGVGIRRGGEGLEARRDVTLLGSVRRN